MQEAVAAYQPTHIGFVCTLSTASSTFILGFVWNFIRGLDDDEYCDAIWGIITGYNAVDAMNLVAGSSGFEIKTVHGGTKAYFYKVARNYTWAEAFFLANQALKFDILNNTPGTDSMGSIVLTEYSPKELHYLFNSENDELVVFSEIYYDKGWNVFIDGKETPYFRDDYVLRAMIVPAGDHEIIWKFEPKVYYV